MNKGLLIVVSGPSGVGKGTVLKSVFESDGNLVYSISCTTRKAREGEQDGVHYHFISKEQFEDNIQNNKMLEYAKYCDNYYGTSAEYVEKHRNEGKDVVLEIETQGALQIMEKCPDAISVFISPPSFEHLKKRLIGRGTEPEDVIDQRVQRAKEELSLIDKYDYVVVNDVLRDAVLDILSILRSERIKNNKKIYIQEVHLK